jgi:hypothetical protein
MKEQCNDTHQDVNKLYFTSDQLSFFDERRAIDHSMKLEDKTIRARTQEELNKELQGILNDSWENELLYEPLEEFDSE